MFILDTDAISLLERAESSEGKRLRARLEAVPIGDKTTTIVTYEEQIRGWTALRRHPKTTSSFSSADAANRPFSAADSWKLFVDGYLLPNPGK